MWVKYCSDFYVTSLSSCEFHENQFSNGHILLKSTDKFLPIKKLKISSVNTMKTYTGSRGTDPLILNPGTRW
jgi:hypothetical protein